MKLNNIPTFLFYDYETFGIDTFLDKPAQFACIRTDMNLNIIDSPQYFYCFPSDDYLPDPNAVLITKITPQYTQKYGMNEYNFSKKIYNIFMHSNTCIVGYNNIHFDDEITRNLFYRNFFDPYKWSWENGNTRWDLLNILRACYALRPQGIKWPHDKQGYPIFKLSELTQINNIVHTHAHDAVSDVYATIEMAKLVKKNQPKLFNFFFQNRVKKKICTLINVKKLDPIVYVSHSFGAMRKNISLVLPIIWHKYNINIVIVIDILSDIKKLISLVHHVSLEKILVRDLFKLGLTLVYLNRCPILAPIKIIRKEDFDRLSLNYELYIKNMLLLKKYCNIFEKIQFCLSQDYFLNKSCNVDSQLYDSFFSSYDKILITKVRNTHSVELKEIDFPFKDNRLKEMFFRYRARNFFSTMNKNEKKMWFNYCQKLFNTQYLNQYKYELDLLLIKYVNDKNKLILLNDVLIYFFKISQKYSLLASK